MNWTYAGNVLVTVGGVLSTVWVLGRILRPWMRDEAAKATEALYKRLKDNEFRYLDQAVQAVREDMKSMREDMKSMEAKLGDRIERSEERLGDRIERSETRLMAALTRLVEPIAQARSDLAPLKAQADAQ